jgi:CHAD domain-containing protein/CYTH domain-containing protein
VSAVSAAILEQRPEEAARRLALGFLDEAMRALERLAQVAGTSAADPRAVTSDPEALHDLRVALRRLRSTLRAYRDVLDGAIPGKRRRALGELARASGAARDAEVQLAWADGITIESAAEATGKARLVALLADQKAAGYRALELDVVPRLRALLPKVREDLSYYTIRHAVFEEPQAHAFRRLLGQLVEAELVGLSTSLRAARGEGGEKRAHEGRIHGKRIRYLLEPFKEAMAKVATAVKALRVLQELLGRLNDLTVRTDALRLALEETARLRARQLADDAARSEAEMRRSAHGQLSAPAPDDGAAYDVAQEGLIAVLKRVLAEKEQLFSVLEREWLDGAQLDLLEAELRDLASELSRTEAPREIERKYLLRALPPHARSVAAKRIDQGYLPGQELIERVRRIQSAEGERFVRTVKLGRGVSRIEVEEPCGRDVFEKLWALTVGRRVEKRRYALADGDHVWEIDEFLDRDLVLCEVELRSERDRPPFPDWLAPFVVRDVTDESQYVNAVLAK